MQEVFVSQGHVGKIVFSDGREFPGLHKRFVMEHAGSRAGNVSASQMWDFVQSISNKDLGVIRHYIKSNTKMSRRMAIVTRKVIHHFPHILQDIPG